MNWIEIASVAVGSGVIGFSGFKAFSSVPEAYRGIKTTLGKAVRDKETGEAIIFQPGGKWMWPYFQTMNTLRIQGNILHYENLTITLKNNLTYSFDAFITYDVIDEPKWIEHILFKNESPDLFVGNHFLKTIQKILHKSEELDVKNASARLKKELSPILEESGFIVQDCEIMLFTETAVSQFLRGVDYRIQKALEYKDQIDGNVLCAALGVNAVVTINNDNQVLSIPLPSADQVLE